MITLIDYGVGNIFAFQNAYKRLNITTKIAKTKQDLIDVEKLILPGVGSFDYAMNQLNASGMREILDKLVLERKIPIIGICVGMQMMGNRSDEGKLEGLKWIDSEILKFDENLIQQRTKLPHMGWNLIDVAPTSDLFAGVEKERFYFVHSFAAQNWEEDPHSPLKKAKVSWSNYGGNFIAAVENGPLSATQFHPEKSGDAGAKLIENWIAKCA
mgnify:CR=1 FL=1